MKILHGIYFHREMVGEPICYSAPELNWLVHASFSQGRKWQKDGKLQTLNGPHDDYLAQIGAVSAAAERPIRYLLSSGYIRRTAGPGFRISVTVKGADLARALDTRAGRLNFWYSRHKGDVVQVLVAAAISVIVSVVTTVIAGRLTTDHQSLSVRSAHPVGAPAQSTSRPVKSS